LRPFRTYFICLLLALTLTGCWDRQELNEISIITGLAIDKGQNHTYKLTVEALNTVALNPKKAGNQAASITFGFEGDSIAELTKRMNEGLSRRPVYSHMRTLVIGKDVAEAGLMQFLNFMERNREIRNDFNLIIANNTPAADILEITYHLQRVSTLKINSQIESMLDMWGGDPNVHLEDFLNALVSPGREPVTAVMSIEGSPKKGNSNKNMEQVEPSTIVVLDGMAVFKGMRYLGLLSEHNARNYLWIVNELKNTSITVPCDEKLINTIHVFHSKTKVKAQYKANKPVINVDIKFESRLDASQCKVDYSKTNNYVALEKNISAAVEKSIKQTIARVQQQYKVDIFGFGEHMERQDYHEFKPMKKDWNEEFTRADIEVSVTAKVRRSGLIMKSILNEIESP
jgi:spore germination protein KC